MLISLLSSLNLKLICKNYNHSFQVGADSQRETTREVKMAKGYNSGFMIDFVDEAAHGAYIQNPDHQQQRLLTPSIDGVARIMTFDFLC